jgi:hypothetical protein
MRLVVLCIIFALVFLSQARNTKPTSKSLEECVTGCLNADPQSTECTRKCRAAIKIQLVKDTKEEFNTCAGCYGYCEAQAKRDCTIACGTKCQTLLKDSIKFFNACENNIVCLQELVATLRK